MDEETTVRIRFLRGKAFEGRDYEPGEEADVPEDWAKRFEQTGAAVRVVEETPAPATEEPAAEEPAEEGTAKKGPARRR